MHPNTYNYLLDLLRHTQSLAIWTVKKNHQSHLLLCLALKTTSIGRGVGIYCSLQWQKMQKGEGYYYIASL